MVDRLGSLLIAGGGIGGLSAALACAQAGFDVRVAERERESKQAGAGIQITPNAGRVLDDLGLEPAIAELASEPAAVDIRGWSGRRIVSLPLARRFRKRHGIPYRTVHRADLQRILTSAASQQGQIEILTDHEVVEFAIHPRGVTIMVNSNGQHHELVADALIGADGINSFVRSVLPGAKPACPTGRSAWRTVIAEADAPASLARDRVGLWLGRRGHVVHYPVRRGREFNIVLVTDSAAVGQAVDLRHRFRSWARPVQDLLVAGSNWQEWPIATVTPSGPWASGRVALLGDAAHAMSPYLAQGGAMAIEDAAVLAQTISESSGNLEPALQRYVSARRARVGKVWRAANGAADLYHMGALTGSVRNSAMRLLGGSGLAWRYEWIYGWKSPLNETRRP